MKSKSILRKVAALLLVAVMALGAIAPAPAAQAKNLNPGVIPPHASYNGHTYAEWSNMWWQWAFSIPWHDAQGNVLNPVADETGVDCGVGQSGHVWFLAMPLAVPGQPSHVIRDLRCTMPHGKAIFLPVQPWSNDNYSQLPDPTCTPNYPTCYSLQFLRDQMADLFETTFANGCPDCQVEVDGRSLQGIFGNGDRVGADNIPYSVSIPNAPKDNPYNYVGFPLQGQAEPIYPQISDGWYVILTPLSAGEHTIYVHTAYPDWFNWDITYHLTVGH